jgi:flagellar export protein FliJ
VKRFRFGLERVLRLKKQKERLAEMRQQQARTALDAALAVVADLQTQVAETAADVAAHAGMAEPVGAWRTRNARVSYLAVQIQAAEAKVAEATRKLQEASAARVQITTEVEALLFLGRQQWQTHRELVAAKEQERLDDVGLRRWARAQTAGPFGGPAPNGGEGR